MDPELKEYLIEEESIFPGIVLWSDERRDHPCWTLYADYFPILNPWSNFETEDLIVEEDQTS